MQLIKGIVMSIKYELVLATICQCTESNGTVNLTKLCHYWRILSGRASHFNVSEFKRKLNGVGNLNSTGGRGLNGKTSCDRYSAICVANKTFKGFDYYYSMMAEAEAYMRPSIEHVLGKNGIDFQPIETPKDFELLKAELKNRLVWDGSW